MAALGLVCGARPLASATTSAAPNERMAAMVEAYSERISTVDWRESSLDLGPKVQICGTGLSASGSRGRFVVRPSTRAPGGLGRDACAGYLA